MWFDGLRERIRAEAPRALCVAFSGGRDSTALLHAFAAVPEARERGLRALHVDHGLHADSSAWAAHCARFCGSLGVPLAVVRVHVGDGRGEGIESAARRARYAAFAESMHDGEWLTLAQHRDDQIETILLKLLRGAGPEGLGGMRVRRPFGRGSLWRPLLDVSRRELDDYLTAHALSPLDDPANDAPRFARNVLRHDILPTLARRWPGAGDAILHSARLCRAADEYLAHEAERALARLRSDGASLDAAGWRALPDALRAPVLDRWLRAQGLPAPTDRPRVELERQVAGAAADAVARITWRGAEVHVWNGRLHATPPLPPPPRDWSTQWNGGRLTLPDGCGTLLAVPADAATASTREFAPPLAVRFRQGGERIKPAGDAYTRRLRDLFQQARVPPWLRVRCPLIDAGGELIAVADRWESARGKSVFQAHGVRPQWHRPEWATPA